MERLTIRNSDGTYSQPTHITFEKMFYKLAEFEDFMEEQGFEDLETFKMAIKLMQSMNSVGVKYCAENQKLKDRWQKLKELLEEDIKNNEKEFNESPLVFARNYITYGYWLLDRIKELEDDEGE